MKVEFLGTGGAITIPVPVCHCTICTEAREKGIPYARSGPATFVHGPDGLIDTPEEIKDQLNRSQVTRIAACVYSHWHPDHTMGRRVWETNHDWRHYPAKSRCTDLYVPERVAQDFEAYYNVWGHLRYFERSGLVRLNRVPDGESFSVGGTQITPIPLADDHVYACLFQDEGRRLFVAADELVGWEPPSSLGHLDLAVIPIGGVEVNPLTGERYTPANHPVLESEATFEQTLDIVRQMDADRVVMSHIEEPDQMGFDDLQELATKLAAEGLSISFAHDGPVVDV